MELLKKALERLPAPTRIALVQHYLEAVPQTEVAAHLGITVGAVEARLTRGKCALRYLLTHELREEAASYGPDTSIQAGWQQTHIWCPVCGQQHLLMKLPDPPGTLAFCCPACSDNADEIGWGYPLSNTRFVKRLAGIRQPKTILHRFISWAHDYYLTAAIHQGVVACAQCGQKRPLQLVLPARFSEGESRYGFSGECPVCGWRDFCSPAGLVQGMPDVQRFWQDHPRMRMVFREPIAEVAGTPAWVIRFESITGADRLDVILAQEMLNPIAVHANDNSVQYKLRNLLAHSFAHLTCILCSREQACLSADMSAESLAMTGRRFVRSSKIRRRSLTRSFAR